MQSSVLSTLMGSYISAFLLVVSHFCHLAANFVVRVEESTYSCIIYAIFPFAHNP